MAIGSVKGSPGATTLALALAAGWPVPGAVVVEAAAAGGDLAARFGLHRTPGLGEWAADTRSTDPGRVLDPVEAYVQALPGVDVEVMLGPAQAQMGPALGLLTASGALKGLAASRPVLVDVGQLSWDSAALPVACAADVLLLVSRAWPEGIDHIQSRRDQLLDLPGLRAQVGLVLVGRLPYRPREISQAVGLPVVGCLPEDPASAAFLAGRVRAAKAWPRRDLPRYARALAESLHASPLRAAPPTIPAAPIVPAPGPETLAVPGPGRVGPGAGASRHRGPATPPAGRAAGWDEAGDLERRARGA